jgi:hypothetical protein
MRTEYFEEVEPGLVFRYVVMAANPPTDPFLTEAVDEIGDRVFTGYIRGREDLPEPRFDLSACNPDALEVERWFTAWLRRQWGV